MRAGQRRPSQRAVALLACERGDPLGQAANDVGRFVGRFAAEDQAGRLVLAAQRLELGLGRRVLRDVVDLDLLAQTEVVERQQRLARGSADSFPEGFHRDAQRELMRGAAPVTTRTFLPSRSPVGSSTNAVRNGQRQRRHTGRDTNPNASYYGILADEEDEIIDILDALDLASKTSKLIAKEKERMTTRADVLRTFAETIATCAREFDHGYAHAVANDFTRSLLHHWNQFLHSGHTTGYSNDPNHVVTRQEPSTSYSRKSFAVLSVTRAFFALVRSTLGITMTHAHAL